ncbi:MAG: dihydroorotate dehydrogenase electron transfer subunit [Candidatus Peribacteraceae bacterium]|nr:dihydroorotate dehydrogenase electron transfer subunit [Candidatus Peribacteraceae bacterium]MDD5743081.1 dihydroorotate dehydrogenase electron transfer subunit [Candidatus Peribacteraceae bacterium]
MTCGCCGNQRLPVTYRIAGVKKETEHVTTFTFAVSLGARPGQFVMLWLPGVDEIPMSVANDDGKKLRITFFAVGDTTKKLAKLTKGDLVGLRGPFGTHYAWEPKQHLVLIAGGYGAAPMFFTASEAAKDGCTLTTIVGARSKEHLLYVDAFSSLPRTTVRVATDDGSQGHKGYNVQLLRELLQGKTLRPRSGSTAHAVDQVFACGPEHMLVAVSDLCFEHKVPCQLSLERYMKCGFGLCGNCAVDSSGMRLCVGGPVVKNELARTITEFGKYHRDDLGKKHPL